MFFKYSYQHMTSAIVWFKDSYRLYTLLLLKTKAKQGQCYIQYRLNLYTSLMQLVWNEMLGKNGNLIAACGILKNVKEVWCVKWNSLYSFNGCLRRWKSTVLFIYSLYGVARRHSGAGVSAVVSQLEGSGLEPAVRLGPFCVEFACLPGLLWAFQLSS